MMQERQNGKPLRVDFFPIFLGATLAAMIDAAQSLIDETVIGNFFDDVAFGAINLLEPYLLLRDFVSYLVCVGGTALIVRARGAQNPEEMRRLYNHSVTCCLIIGMAFSAVYSIFDRPLVSLVAGGSPAYPFSLEAFYWDRFVVLITPLYDFLFTYVLYLNGALVSSISMIVKLALNTALSIYMGGTMGISGVTCATFIADTVGVLILIVFVIVKERGFNYRPYLNAGYVKELTLLGIPEASFFLSIFILEAGVNALALRYYSIQGVAVAAVLVNLYEIAAFVSEGVSEYETVALNQAMGEKNREALKYGMNITFRAVLIESLVFSLLFLLAAPLLVGVFDIDDPETAKSAITAIRIMAVPTLAIITVRVTAIFCQYTGRIGRAVLTWLCSFGFFPLLLAMLLCSVSLEALVWGAALGPVLAIAMLWALPSGRKSSAGVELKRTKLVFADGEEVQ